MSAWNHSLFGKPDCCAKGPWLQRFLGAFLLIAASVMFWLSLPSSARESASVVASSDLETLNKADKQDCLTKPIEEIRPGDWVLAGNPEVSANMADTAVNRAGWRLVTLQAMGPGDDLFDIQLLRSQEWIAAAGAEVGGTIPLCIPEQGLDGPADVLDIAPCPPAKAKTDPEARLVTGTFTHHREIYELSVAALEEPIGTTDNHPFWSVDRQEFVPAGQLNIGERLQLASGEATTVTKANYRRGPPERVYNLEVDADHTYHVTDAGVLVHNNCPKITVIGRDLDLAKFDRIDHVDTWRKSGDLSVPPGSVTWRINRKWLDERIERGDRFMLATDRRHLPNPRKLGSYIPGVPNGYFTARELDYLEGLGIVVKYIKVVR